MSTEDTRNFRMSADTHTRLRKVAEAESRTMTAQLDLILAEWMDARGYTITRSGKVKQAAPVTS
jgi:hypothetical protein